MEKAPASTVLRPRRRVELKQSGSRKGGSVFQSTKVSYRRPARVLLQAVEAVAVLLASAEVLYAVLIDARCPSVRNEIVKRVAENDTVILIADTGSGKTTRESARLSMLSRRLGAHGCRGAARRRSRPL